MSYQIHNISDFNYNLPEERIAKFPLPERDDSKLLIFNSGEIEESCFTEIPKYLDSADLLVFNNTKVIRARLMFYKKTGAKIEIFCLEPQQPADYALSFQAHEQCSWKCIIGNSKKWKSEKLEMILSDPTKETRLTVEKISNDGESHIINFQWDNSELNFSDILDKIGQTPIPPYLNRLSDDSDITRYQTVYSKIKGSVAAPTAGLHFTEKVFENLRNKNVKTTEITLHVGAGTFKPVKSLTSDEHEMHTEHFSINFENLMIISTNFENITSVGTTTVRTLESIYWIGVKLILKLENAFHISQKEVYNLPQNITQKDAFDAIKNEMTKEKIDILWASTQIMIVPGYNFKIVKKLITNFHQPQSTLLLLVSAFVKENNWQKIYEYALANNFRFLSYGDSSLLIP